MWGGEGEERVTDSGQFGDRGGMMERVWAYLG